ncbi:site-2 protease family protein [Candidatus Wolfebacteria bacterium]|nr:MAG: site-2 protease family protein [Candidatus Wolfebacteria bacterium]
MQEILTVVILIMSVVIHEISHGYAALAFGDKTALHAGRLTLNPLKHLDPIGSLIVPLLFIILPGNFIIGWAKPVPYNPHNLTHKKWGTLFVASAGILANLFIALVFGLLIRLTAGIEALGTSFIVVAGFIVFINVLLAIFNLVPIPPLDGSKILFTLLPQRYQYIGRFMERYAIFILLFFIFYLWTFIQPIIFWLFELFSGISAFSFFGLL